MFSENNYNLSDSAKYLKVSRPTFYKIIKRWHLKSERVGQVPFFKKKDLDFVKTQIDVQTP